MNNLKEGFEVEWCEEIPKDENGDSDMDKCQFQVRDFSSKEEAIEFAKTVAPKDAFGAARIHEFVTNEIVPGCFDREQIGEVEEVFPE